MTEEVQTTEAVAAPEQSGVQLQLQDLLLAAQVIQLAASRGATRTGR